MLEGAFVCVKKTLASPIHGGGKSEARSLRPQARAASNRRRRLLASVEGVPTFLKKVGISEYLLCKYSGSPRPSATPLINEGGKSVGSSAICNAPSIMEGAFAF